MASECPHLDSNLHLCLLGLLLFTLPPRPPLGSSESHICKSLDTSQAIGSMTPGNRLRETAECSWGGEGQGSCQVGTRYKYLPPDPMGASESLIEYVLALAALGPRWMSLSPTVSRAISQATLCAAVLGASSETPGSQQHHTLLPVTQHRPQQGAVRLLDPARSLCRTGPPGRV